MKGNNNNKISQNRAFSGSFDGLDRTVYATQTTQEGSEDPYQIATLIKGIFLFCFGFVFAAIPSSMLFIAFSEPDTPVFVTIIVPIFIIPFVLIGAGVLLYGIGLIISFIIKKPLEQIPVFNKLTKPTKRRRTAGMPPPSSLPEQRVQRYKYCINCGTPIPPGSLTCPNCNAPATTE